MPRIDSAPLDLVAAVHQGIEVHFAGLELNTELPPWHFASEDYDAGFSSSFEFKLHAMGNEVTCELDAEFKKNVEIWEAKVQEHGASITGSIPSLPSDKLFDCIEAEVTDDLGTEYFWVGDQSAASDSPWEATWIYSPSPPKKAEQLVLNFVVDGHETGHSCTIDLTA